MNTSTKIMIPLFLITLAVGGYGLVREALYMIEYCAAIWQALPEYQKILLVVGALFLLLCLLKLIKYCGDTIMMMR